MSYVARRKRHDENSIFGVDSTSYFFRQMFAFIKHMFNVEYFKIILTILAKKHRFTLYCEGSWNGVKGYMVWSEHMKRNRRQKLSFCRVVSGFVATYDISLCRYCWLWSFLYRRNSRAASSNQNVRANELNLVLSCAFRYDEFKTVTRKWTQSGPYFIYILPAISAEWHRQFAHGNFRVTMTGSYDTGW